MYLQVPGQLGNLTNLTQGRVAMVSTTRPTLFIQFLESDWGPGTKIVGAYIAVRMGQGDEMVPTTGPVFNMPPICHIWIVDIALLFPRTLLLSCDNHTQAAHIPMRPIALS